MKNIKWIDAEDVHQILDYPSLIEALRKGFSGEIIVPQRTHLDFPNPPHKRESSLLMMPALQPGKDLGIKIATVSPENYRLKLPAIHAIYIHLNAATGQPLAIMDANSITTRRTAATSALAASFLAKPQSTSLLMIGTGALAPQLIAAHAAVNPLQKVFLWGRNFEKASRLAFQLMAEMEIDIQPIKEIDAFIHEADIISTATLSPDPLIDGKLLVPGQHLDLVGSYRRDMRESDDECILKSDLFVDVMPNPLKESGDFAIPLAEGLITKDDIKGDLIDLCKTSINGRMSFEQITLFKSVGYALEDLVAAQLIMERID